MDQCQPRRLVLVPGVHAAREGRLSPAVGQFRDVLILLSRLRAEGVIHDYAVGGAVAVSLWAEPVATQDLDVIVTIAGDAHPLDPLRPLLEWFDRHGQAFEGEHVVIAGVPVQFLVAWSPLVREAVATAAETAYDPSDPNSPTIRLIQPTYLVAMWQTDRGADTPRRRERMARLREAGLVDDALLTELLSRTKT
jgi:diadenosine tetraphosphatase ApaH/serine/threonine PP2A family protein phosphatase